MLSIQASKILLKQMGLSDEDVDRCGELFEPQIEFHKYLMKHLNISSAKAEQKTKDFSKKFVTKELKLESNKNISDVERFAIGAKSLKMFAIKNGYDKELAEQMETGMAEMMDILQKVNVIKEDSTN